MENENLIKVDYYKVLATIIQRSIREGFGGKLTPKEIVANTAAEVVSKAPGDKLEIEIAMHRIYTDLCRLSGQFADEEANKMISDIKIDL